MHKAALGAALALLISGAAAAQGNGWGGVSTPAPGPTRIIGGTSLGCIAGAVQLPSEGPGWQAVRVSRNRHWGHPVLIDWVRDFAGEAQRRGFPDLWIGDLAQPRGGPMTYGHASHQTGIDVDIWLDLSAKPRVPAAAREDIRVASLVLPDETGVDPARFTDRHAALIRLAVERPGVDRLLVNHAIKRELCRRHRGEAWLRRVRPWRGHDSHMHVRLRCPAGQPECLDIAPPPPGDGCDASLDWWLSEEARRPTPRPPGPPPRLPAACAGVLAAR
ncbi:penicillin-insensitive murein endopeptidase [Roseomonas sp. PWR1]|uniref:Penicillin-insensitive murein endopeptidase n=1 Tax=Roseomonas nitratireducens TaxID=2820810 RepID=A0ABS4AXM6_9PROT|nr:penicillin-insensitive murein endopeptidase [Neoroseomonas nitratireducens]MBP0466042.1 penicillin-insensitive murein endopeptidase [Neoroseomonas nitratireducens]